MISVTNIKYCISVWGPKFSNEFAEHRKGNSILLTFSKKPTKQKQQQQQQQKKQTIKSKFIETENEGIYFSNDFFMFLFLFSDNDNSKWKLISMAWSRGFVAFYESFLLLITHKLYEHYDCMLSSCFLYDRVLSFYI